VSLEEAAVDGQEPEAGRLPSGNWQRPVAVVVAEAEEAAPGRALGVVTVSTQY